MPAPAPSPTIMVVDDSPEILRYLAEILRSEGFRVVSFPDGEMAMAAARKTPPDLILLDVRLSGADGFEICQSIKEIESLAEVPVIFISGLGDPQDKVRAFTVGGVDYISKPFYPGEIIARIRTHCRIKQLQDELRGRYESLQELERYRDTLVRMIVHDLRSPLTAMIGLLSAFFQKSRPQLDERNFALLSHIQASMTMMSEMVSTILDVSRLEEGNTHVDILSCDLGELLGVALEPFRGWDSRCQIEFTPPKTPLMVDCDPSLTRRVVHNLVGNALKFSPGGENVHVTLETRDGWARVLVRDRGPGIPPEFSERIFEKFFSVSTPPQKKVTHGLGLAFSKLAMSAQKGKIGVDSQPGQGSTFWFSLPLTGAKPDQA